MASHADMFISCRQNARACESVRVSMHMHCACWRVYLIDALSTKHVAGAVWSGGLPVRPRDVREGAVMPTREDRRCVRVSGGGVYVCQGGVRA